MFTYLIGWSQLDRYYYGCRYGKNAHPSQLWTTYFTSSNVVKQMRENFGEPDVVQIRKLHTNRHDCIVWEHKVLRRLNAAHNVRWLNVTNGSLFANGEQKIRVKDKMTGVIIGAVTKDHPLYLSGEYVYYRLGNEQVQFKNFIHFVDPITMEHFKLHRDDPRIVSNGLVPWLKLFCHVIDLTTGQTVSVKRDDPRIKSGELVGTSHRKVPAKDPKNPHIKFQASVDDPRWLTGDLVHTRAGHKHKNPQNASRPKEKNGRWTGVSDDQYIEMIIKLIEESGNTLRWRQIAAKIKLPVSRYHLKERVEQIYKLPHYHDRGKVTQTS